MSKTSYLILSDITFRAPIICDDFDRVWPSFSTQLTVAGAAVRRGSWTTTRSNRPAAALVKRDLTAGKVEAHVSPAITTRMLSPISRPGTE